MQAPRRNQGDKPPRRACRTGLQIADAAAMLPGTRIGTSTINHFAPPATARRPVDQRLSSGSLFGTPSHLAASSIDGILLVSTGHSFASSALIDM